MDGLFIHVHKTAGTTVKEVLFQHLEVKNVRSLVGLHKGKKMWRSVERKDIPDREFDEVFKFCFVRNPWDRVVSAYLHNRRKWGEPFVITFREFILNILPDDNIVWDAHWLRGKCRSDIKHEIMLWEGKGHAVPYSHPGYFMDSMDFIGRFESFDCDFRRVLRELGHMWDRRMPHENRTRQRRPYATYYTPRLREAVGELYYPDIVKFNYVFDDAKDNDRPTSSE